MIKKNDTNKILIFAASIMLIISFFGFTASSASNGTELQLLEGMTFSNNTAQTTNSNFTVTISLPQIISQNTYKKTVIVDVNNYSISRVEDFDLPQISGASYILSDFKPILPLINVKLNLSLNSSIKEIQLVPLQGIYFGQLNIPSSKRSAENNQSASIVYTNVTDVTGLYPAPRYVTSSVNSSSNAEFYIGISPFQFNTTSKDTTFFNKTLLEITYDTSNPVVINELTTDKPDKSYNSGEIVNTGTSFENIGAETITGMHLELALRNMVGQVLASTSSAVFDLPAGASKINTSISTNGLPQGAYVLTITAFDNNNTSKASTSTFIDIFSGKISNFVITPNPVKQGNDIIFDFEFENYAPTGVVANSSVSIYDEAGTEIANLQAAAITVDAGSSKTFSVAWNTLGKDAGNYTATALITTDKDMFGPLSGQFKLTVPPVVNFSSNVTEGYAPLSVQFKDLSANAAAWNWSFGDGNSSTDQNPIHTFSIAGNYNVNLTISSGNDNSSKTAAITVIANSSIGSGNSSDASNNGSNSSGSNNGGSNNGGSNNGGSNNGGSSNGESSGSESSSVGSSGGGISSPEPQSNVEAKELSQAFVRAGKTAKFEFKRNATCVVNVSFDSKRSLGKITTIAQMLKEKSSLVPELPAGEVYKSFNIWVGNGGIATKQSIENPALSFRIEKSWLQHNSINSPSITLNQYNDKKWEQFPVNTAGEDADYLYFTSNVSGFSSFAITGLSESASDQNKESLPSIGSLQQSNDTNDTGINNTKINNTKTNNISTKVRPDKKIPGFEIEIGIVCLLGVLLFIKIK